MTNKKTPADFLAKYAPPLDNQWFSLGYACMFLNINPNQLSVLMDEADLRFSKVVDGVMYFRGYEMELLTETHNRLVEEILAGARKVEAAPNN